MCMDVDVGARQNMRVRIPSMQYTMNILKLLNERMGGVILC